MTSALKQKPRVNTYGRILLVSSVCVYGSNNIMLYILQHYGMKFHGLAKNSSYKEKVLTQHSNF